MPLPQDFENLRENLRCGPIPKEIGYGSSNFRAEIIFLGFSDYHSGYPRHRENRGNGQKKSLSGKTGYLEMLPKEGKHREFCLLKL